jgi:hypothetical protein
LGRAANLPLVPSLILFAFAFAARFATPPLLTWPKPSLGFAKRPCFFASGFYSYLNANKNKKTGPHLLFISSRANAKGKSNRGKSSIHSYISPHMRRKNKSKSGQKLRYWFLFLFECE